MWNDMLYMEIFPETDSISERKFYQHPFNRIRVIIRIDEVFMYDFCRCLQAAISTQNHFQNEP